MFNDDEDGVDENKKKRPLVPLGNYISFQSGEKLTVCSIPCIHNEIQLYQQGIRMKILGFSCYIHCNYEMVVVAKFKVVSQLKV